MVELFFNKNKRWSLNQWTVWAKVSISSASADAAQSFPILLL